ncbi:tRNA (adenosine(37)-N6)-threonylcarbamoyltransferase complex dimerization subunit type 1 TsaB [Sedimentisphaera salicampi]|uniref:tRNA (adenosine(37)-N6)-threonylcarbamoyltransferase complex dimerization subunit type 1 TsaB n=1 Tax=Sedimentisphaera salicampi TaxID=1941349 RepID=UPI000B9CC137|nr:tRNA (adenosine(37)-N6)-threonylcarbamoyltransferase complex dimerization subunit type 1 TsaB [Sedimentisphaera salicampi]OXU15291.1 UGMP family protein [Sedimentisphaera salicampi]
MAEIILCIDTSGRAGSAAICTGRKILGEKFFSGQMKHAAELLPSIQNILEEGNISVNEITHLAVTQGPGSYTGLRIGITAAKMIALAGRAKLIGLSSMDATRENCERYIEQSGEKFDRIVPVLDAKRGQFFSSMYEFEDGRWEKKIEDSLFKPKQIIEMAGDKNIRTALLGEGLKYYSKKFEAEGNFILPQDFWNIRASSLCRLAWPEIEKQNFQDPSGFAPKYLRRSDAEENRAPA